MESCKHVKSVKDISPKTKGCEECEKIGSGLVALNLCLSCGHVGCCDSSVGKHATKHFKETGHPMILRLPKRPESWKWCYIDKKYL